MLKHIKTPVVSNISKIYNIKLSFFTILTEILWRKFFIEAASLSRKSFMNSMKFSLPWNLVKLASVCSVLATRVRFLAAFSLGYSRKEHFQFLTSQVQSTHNIKHIHMNCMEAWLHTKSYTIRSYASNRN